MPEAILDPALPIIDPHHHLWDRSMLLAQLPPPKHAFEHILRKYPRYLLDNLLADTGSGHNVRATIYLECGAFYRADAGPFAPVGEVEFVNGVAAMAASGVYGETRACAGIVGHTDLTRGDGAVEVLEALIAAGNGRFRGIRHSASWDADPDVLGPLARTPQGLYRSDAFRAGFKHLAKLDLSFDAWMVEPQIPDLVDLARAFPDTTIILDHVGTPLGIGSYKGKQKERFATWSESIAALSACPNVHVKLGGLAMPFCGFDSFTPEKPQGSEALARDWAPYVETCIAAFGADRCMFESNFPVDGLACTYAELWNAFKRIAADYSAAEKAALFAGTAGRVYRVAV